MYGKLQRQETINWRSYIIRHSTLWYGAKIVPWKIETLKRKARFPDESKITWKNRIDVLGTSHGINEIDEEKQSEVRQDDLEESALRYPKSDLQIWARMLTRRRSSKVQQQNIWTCFEGWVS